MNTAHKNRFSLKVYCLIATLLGIVLLRCDAVEMSPLWQSGIDGYDTYRIPAIVVTTNGTILAFCEGRKNGRSDTGNIDLLMKRSSNQGRSWSQQSVLWDDSGNTCGNPCPIIDRQTGAIILLMTWNRGDDHESAIIAEKSKDTRRIFISISKDDGISWSRPREITAQTKKDNWTWYATGPGAGIQIEKGPNAGRLIAPCDHIEAKTKKYYSHVIYSDDHGASWHLGGTTPRDRVNECQVIELSQNRLMLNMRNYDPGRRYRQVAYSADGGLSWAGQDFDSALIEPICQASLRAHSWNSEGKRALLLFSNPASKSKRENMKLRSSVDEGKTWTTQLILNPGPSAYSDLGFLDDSQGVCLFEGGLKHPYESILFVKFPIKTQ